MVRMKIIALADNIYTKVKKELSNGGLVIAPSDTVYGALVDATNEKAVRKLNQFKNRPPGKAISIFISDLTMMKQYVTVSEKQSRLLKKFFPGPFTIILASRHKVSKLLEAEKGTLGIRLPHYDFITTLVKRYGKPVTATSANLSGRSPHYQISSLLKELPQNKKDLIDLIVDAGKLPRNKPSTIVDLTKPSIKIIRKGDIIIQSKSFITQSVDQTKKIGQFLLQKYIKDIFRKPVVFIIKGDLGVGKTVLVKGIGAMLGIDNIISPTFIISYEYKTDHKEIEKLYHFDLYNIQDPEEFKYLGIEEVLKPGSLFCFEWGEKTGDIIDMLKNRATIVYITMKYISEKEREIKIIA